MVCPTPAMPPTRICCVLPPNGLIVSSLFVLWLAVTSAVQLTPLPRGLSSWALRLASIPEFFMLPMLVVRTFEKLVPAAMGTVKIRSVVFLLYQSTAPVNR